MSSSCRFVSSAFFRFAWFCRVAKGGGAEAGHRRYVTDAKPCLLRLRHALRMMRSPVDSVDSVRYFRLGEALSLFASSAKHGGAEVRTGRLCRRRSHRSFASFAKRKASTRTKLVDSVVLFYILDLFKLDQLHTTN